MSSDNPNQYNFPFRTNYEIRITLIWLIAGLITFLCPFVIDVPERVYQIFGVIFMFVGVLLGRNGIEIYIRKSRLKGYELKFIDPNAKSTLKMFGIKDKAVIERVCRKQR